MPYFMDGNCVMKGTKENRKAATVVKCHKTHKDALAHLRALEVNVSDASASLEDVPGMYDSFERKKVNYNEK